LKLASSTVHRPDGKKKKRGDAGYGANFHRTNRTKKKGKDQFRDLLARQNFPARKKEEGGEGCDSPGLGSDFLRAPISEGKEEYDTLVALARQKTRGGRRKKAAPPLFSWKLRMRERGRIALWWRKKVVDWRPPWLDGNPGRKKGGNG